MADLFAEGASDGAAIAALSAFSFRPTIKCFFAVSQTRMCSSRINGCPRVEVHREPPHDPSLPTNHKEPPKQPRLV